MLASMTFCVLVFWKICNGEGGVADTPAVDLLRRIDFTVRLCWKDVDNS